MSAGRTRTGACAAAQNAVSARLAGTANERSREAQGLTVLPPVHRRRWLHPASLPTQLAINVLDLDVTKNCNLRCTYCFKSDTVRPRAETMSLEVAMTAVDWLIEASMGARALNANLIGGEPLLAWPTIEKLVPYAKRRAAQFGKTIQFGTTTNLTLVNERIIEFSRQWGMGWHCSIDGIPEVQNAQRPGVGGAPSARRAERGARLVLTVRPLACARATVLPQNARNVFASLLYFEQLGFKNFAFAVAGENDWRREHFVAWDQQWAKIADYAIQRYRQERPLRLMAFEFLLENYVSQEVRAYSCGAGRGSALVDHRGDIWPCHRWDGADFDSGSAGQWRFGNIFQAGFNHDLHAALLQRDRTTTRKADCSSCPLDRICAGGCPAGNLTATGSIYRQDHATCEAIRIIYRHALRLHDTLKAEGNASFMRRFCPTGQTGSRGTSRPETVRDNGQ